MPANELTCICLLRARQHLHPLALTSSPLTLDSLEVVTHEILKDDASDTFTITKIQHS